MAFLFNAFIGGFLVFMSEELYGAARYSVPTIGIVFIFGLVLSTLARRSPWPGVAWPMAIALTTSVAPMVDSVWSLGG